MARQPRQHHRPAFEARVAVVAIKAEKTLVALEQDSRDPSHLIQP